MAAGSPKRSSAPGAKQAPTSLSASGQHAGCGATVGDLVSSGPGNVAPCGPRLLALDRLWLRGRRRSTRTSRRAWTAGSTRTAGRPRLSRRRARPRRSARSRGHGRSRRARRRRRTRRCHRTRRTNWPDRRHRTDRPDRRQRIARTRRPPRTGRRRRSWPRRTGRPTGYAVRRGRVRVRGVHHRDDDRRRRRPRADARALRGRVR